MNYRILIILTPAFDPNAGGVQRSTYKMSSYFKKNGNSTFVYSYQKEGHKEFDIAKLYHAKYDNGFRNEKNHNDLKNIIEEIKPDIVINQMPYEREIGNALKLIHTKLGFLLLGCLRNTLYSVKLNLDTYIETVVPDKAQFLFKNSIGKQVLLSKHKSKHEKDLKYILDTYDYFVMFGPPNIDELKYFVGNYKLDKTHLIPNSILSVLPEIPQKEKRILWLSRLSYKQKRADLILPFWKKVMHKLPDWEFDIVGDGDAYKDLEQQIINEKIPRVKLYGKQKPDDYYKRSPIYIMTSSFEGFPNTLIEAQSFASVPVVYNNYPICSWAVKDGKSGLLIKPFNIDEMAEKVVDLVNNQNKLDQLMNEALINAREFEINNVGKKWISFFDQNIKNKRINS